MRPIDLEKIQMRTEKSIIRFDNTNEQVQCTNDIIFDIQRNENRQMNKSHSLRHLLILFLYEKYELVFADGELSTR